MTWTDEKRAKAMAVRKAKDPIEIHNQAVRAGRARALKMGSVAMREMARTGGLATFAKRTTEEISAFARKGAIAANAKRTPEQKAAFGRAGGLRRYGYHKPLVLPSDS